MAPLAVPVFTVGVGETEGFTDVRIAKFGAPEFAFRGREFKIDLTVQAIGHERQNRAAVFQPR